MLGFKSLKVTQNKRYKYTDGIRVGLWRRRRRESLLVFLWTCPQHRRAGCLWPAPVLCHHLLPRGHSSGAGSGCSPWARCCRVYERWRRELQAAGGHSLLTEPWQMLRDQESTEILSWKIWTAQEPSQISSWHGFAVINLKAKGIMV